MSGLDIVSFFEGFAGDGFLSYVFTVTRFILPALAFWILYRTVYSMLRERYEPEIWAYLALPDGTRVPLRHWECVLGRARSSDVIVNFPTVSRTHAAMIRDDKGYWRITDLESKGGVQLRGKDLPEGGGTVHDGDCISLAGVELYFICLTEEERRGLGETRTKPGRTLKPGGTFFILTVFQAVIALSHSISSDSEHTAIIALGFGCLCAAQWCYYLVMRSIRRMGFEVETLAFFLCTLGFSVTATSAPDDMLKQVALLIAGIVCYLALGFLLRDLGRSKKFSVPAAVAAVGLLALNLLLARTETYGARNWIEIAGFSLQPSEFVKIVYIYTGAAALDKLFTSRNVITFIVFSAICVGALALMSDFGSAVVFFAAFLVIAFMRSGNLATVLLAITGAVLAAMLMLSIKPYIAQRFATWGHVWDYANDAGFQQTRTLVAIASGGLFGQGAGRGWLHTIFAADTDLVFGILCEELGLITAFIAVLAIVALAAFTVKSAANGRSSFYVIAACATVTMFMVQLCLNVFGSIDILPFTGVTFPFVSRGGSSLISCWALLSFIKAADTRQNASFAIKLTSRRRDYLPGELPEDEPDEDYEDASEYDDGYTDEYIDDYGDFAGEDYEGGYDGDYETSADDFDGPYDYDNGYDDWEV